MKANNLTELYHYGIKGMKWDKKNGPPYPLKPSAMSVEEKKYSKGYKNASKSEKVVPKSNGRTVSETTRSKSNSTYTNASSKKAVSTGSNSYKNASSKKAVSTGSNSYKNASSKESIKSKQNNSTSKVNESLQKRDTSPETEVYKVGEKLLSKKGSSNYKETVSKYDVSANDLRKKNSRIDSLFRSFINKR